MHLIGTCSSFDSFDYSQVSVKVIFFLIPNKLRLDVIGKRN